MKEKNFRIKINTLQYGPSCKLKINKNKKHNNKQEMKKKIVRVKLNISKWVSNELRKNYN